MDADLLLPKSPGGIGLLLVVLGACGWFFVYTIQRFNKRSQAEGDLDTRLPLILGNVTAGWEKLNAQLVVMMDKAEARAERAIDEREALLKQFLEYTTTRDESHKMELGKLREEKLESDKRMHSRLDECIKRDSDHAAVNQEIRRRLDLLENRQYSSALLTPVAPVPVTPVAPAAPAATTTFAMPPTGFTVTPGVQT